MKSIVFKSLALATVLASAAACTNDMEYTDTTATPVQSFYEPADGKVVKLIPSATASLFFEWEAAHAGDGAMPQYELAFYAKDNTTTPIYTVTSDANGAKPMASVSHKTLAKVMALAGVGMGDTDDIKWGVISYAGVNGTNSTKLYNLTVTRFIGFDEVPDELYLAGAASETGDDYSKARAFSKDGELFEMFSELKAGQKIIFSADKEGLKLYRPKTGTSFVDDNASEYTVEENGTYRINIDFSTASVSFRKIDGVYMRFTEFSFNIPGMPNGNYAAKFNYKNNGLFEWEGTIVTKDTGWSWDPFESRHNFVMEYADGSKCTWGPLNAGNDGKPGNVDITSGDFTMVEYAGTVNNKWKLPDVWYNKPLVYTLYFNNDNGAFKHFAKVK